MIAYLGTVYAIRHDPRGGMRLTVAVPAALIPEVAPKDSIAVSGVCLTAVSTNTSTITFDVVPETLQRSTFAKLREGDPVNVELSQRLGDRLGGHLTYGHVDAVAEILAKESEGQGYRLTVATPANLSRYLVEKGYVALDGVSLTVAAVSESWFQIALIPETATRTTLGSKGAGDLLNVEIDPVARYLLAAAEPYGTPEAVTSEELEWAYEI
ncbi:MAG TPA: riboflavin synthase [Candidatus Acidoferrales bacterium]|nr:riboflavin synthase [Candidatus Acidoferrales bacterium]